MVNWFKSMGISVVDSTYEVEAFTGNWNFQLWSGSMVDLLTAKADAQPRRHNKVPTFTVNIGKITELNKSSRILWTAPCSYDGHKEVKRLSWSWWFCSWKNVTSCANSFPAPLYVISVNGRDNSCWMTLGDESSVCSIGSLYFRFLRQFQIQYESSCDKFVCNYSY